MLVMEPVEESIIVRFFHHLICDDASKPRKLKLNDDCIIIILKIGLP